MNDDEWTGPRPSVLPNSVEVLAGIDDSVVWVDLLASIWDHRADGLIDGQVTLRFYPGDAARLVEKIQSAISELDAASAEREREAAYDE